MTFFEPAAGYVFSGSPFSPLPSEGEGAGVRGRFWHGAGGPPPPPPAPAPPPPPGGWGGGGGGAFLARGTPHPAFGHPLPQGERVNGMPHACTP